MTLVTHPTEPSPALAALSARIGGPRARFHAFAYRARRLVYDLVSGTLAELDAAAFAVLFGIERGRSQRAIEDDVAAAGGDLDEVVCELERLAGVGLFALEPLEEQAEREETLHAYLEHRPNKLMLLVQTSCNLRCTYCYEVQSGFHAKGGGMELVRAQESIEHLIGRAGGRKRLEVTFFGGEPLMSFALVREVVAYCKRRGAELGLEFGFQMTTNAVLLTDEVARFLVDERFGVMISLDGAPARNDHNRVDLGGRGSGERALANAKRLVAAQRAAGLRPATIRATMTPGNHSLLSIGAELEAEGFARIVIGASVGRAHAKGPHDLGAAEAADLEREFEQVLDMTLAWVDGVGPKPAGDAIAKLLARLEESLAHPRLRPGIGCGVARNMQAVTADGTIYPCHRYAGEEGYALGTLERGLDPERVEGYYREILDGYDRHCSRCWARFTCGGQCPWYLSRPDGHVGLPDAESCDAIRASTEKQLWLYDELRRRAERAAAAKAVAP